MATMAPRYVRLNLETGVLDVTSEERNSADGRTLWIEVLELRDQVSLLASLAATARRVIAGSRLIEEGDRLVGYLTLAGEEAHDELARLIGSSGRSAA